jgi:ankyrin repeat protein
MVRMCTSLIRSVNAPTGSPSSESPQKGFSALHLACEKGHAEVVKILLHHGANINLKSQVRVQRPLSPHSDLLYLPWSQTLTATPLHLASQHNHVEIISILLENGALVNDVDIGGACALHKACLRGFSEAVNVLLAYGAMPNLQNKVSDLGLALVTHSIGLQCISGVRHHFTWRVTILMWCLCCCIMVLTCI